MKRSSASQGLPASELISKRIAELGDWRGTILSRMRKLIQEADPDVVEEWKWMGTPVWSHDGNVRRAIDIREGEEVDESSFKALVCQAVAQNSAGKSKPSKKAKS
jgi:hypothetical protein